MLRTLNEIPACQQAGELFLAKIRTLNFEKLLSSGGQKSFSKFGVRIFAKKSSPACWQALISFHSPRMINLKQK